ncbi:MAG: RecX family transcriptional regulator [Muribaculaceae bacterium]|nr:RecX family transcriptional regulator [Muribaculaceae bacterium]
MSFSSRRKEISPEKALLRLEELCARSEQCSAELMRKLRAWNINPEDAAAILRSLKARRFVDDERFARAFVRDKYRFNHWGRIKIAMALRAKHIDDDTISQAMEEIDQTLYLKILRALLNAKNRAIPADTEAFDRRVKLFRFATSRGFESSFISKIVTELL